MCDIDLKTCEKSSKYKKKDIVDLGKKCGVDPYLPNGREKTRKVICTEIVNQYSANPSSSDNSDDDEGQNIDPICGISEKDCNELDKVNLLALGEYCGVDVYTPKGNLKSSKSICKAVNGLKQTKSPSKADLKNMDLNDLKKLAKKLDIDWKNKNLKELQYLIAKQINAIKSISPSRSRSRSPSPKRSRSPSVQNMKKKDLKALAKALGAKEKKIEKMDKQDLIDYILSRKKSPSPSPRPRSPSPRPRSPSPRPRSPSPRPRSPSPRPRSPSPRPRYRAADLLGKKVVELRELAKSEGLTKWNGKTPSKMLKQDLVDFLMHISGGGKIPKTPSPIKPSFSPKNRSELALLKVPELKAMALSYGLKKFKDKTPSQLRKNDFIDFIISKQKSRSISPQISLKESKSPPKYKSKEFVTTDESEDELVVTKKKKKSVRRSRTPSVRRSPPASVRRSRTPSVRRSPPASVRRSRTPSVRRSPPASVRRSRTPSVRRSPPASVRRSRTPSVRRSPPASVGSQPLPQPTNSPSITVDPSVTPPQSKKIAKPDLPVYIGINADKDLEILANEFNYRVVQVKGDGNCLFRAVSKSLKLNENKSYSHEALRAMVITYLKKNKDFLEPYLEYVTESGDTTPEEYQKNVKRYIKNMSKSGTWGDFICLKVLSEELKVQFNLLILNTRQFQLISNDDSFTTLIPLGFIDDYHYTALVPINVSEIPLPPSVQPSIRPSVQPSIRPSVQPSIRPSVQPSIRPSVQPSIRPSVQPSIVPPSIPSIKPSIQPSVVPPSIQPSIRPSIQPSVVPPSIQPSIRPSIQPSVVPPSIQPSIRPSIQPSIKPQPSKGIAPKIPPPVFKKVKPLSSVNELLEIMDKVKPYVFDDISQLQKAERQIMVSLGM
ncbi:Putative ubiquitin thioesterase, Virion core protein [Invertebrate iridescent virus 22]|uniref:Ubiquitin thioesterase, Virion core protein n=1 Tax=Invertebrate iridescent virus 22 TaxID=345198 RepID=S6DA38_9VIRU|nr:Putative ubiquitin thioesterase, Virion core protein [Invertebrate iridescent virus 22]CCV01688.1 Putative ubiquitin thioesterase, Virion core protein [Invertebrate iridescent virus 22]